MKETLKYNSIITIGFFSGVVFSTQFLQVPDDFTAPAEPDLEKLLAHPSWDLQSISPVDVPFSILEIPVDFNGSQNHHSPPTW